MRLIEITSPIYQDKSGMQWPINTSKELPVVKQYIDKIIQVTQEAIRDFKYPMAYHFWIRLNQEKTISNFLDTLKKNYLQRNGFLIKYIQAKESESDGALGEHHHIILFVDNKLTRPGALSYFLNRQTGEGKLLFLYGVPKSRDALQHMPMRTEVDIKNVVHRASYLAKTRSKTAGDGVIQMTTSRPRKETTQPITIKGL